MGCCYNDSRDSGCGCTGCLLFLIIMAVVLAVILFLLSALLQIMVGVVTVIVRLIILVVCVFAGLLIIVPAFVSFFCINRNIVFAIRDAIADNHLYRKPLAPPLKRFFSRFWGFTKDSWSYYLKHSVNTVKDYYAKCGNPALRWYARAWHFLVMISVSFFTFVAPVLLVIMLIFGGFFMRRVIYSLITEVSDFFRNLLSFNDIMNGDASF